MVEIKYVDGSEDTVETVDCGIYKYSEVSDTVEKVRKGHFRYDNITQCFIVYDHKDDSDCMMIPREFVKSIRHIEV